MSRSSYVYVVLDQGDPVVGFTVKHEMVTWLRRARPALLPCFEIWRVPDNGFPGRHPTKMWVVTDSNGYLTEVR